MKNCEEMFDSLLKRRDEYLTNKKRNKKFAVSICTSAFVLVIGSILAIGLLNKDFFTNTKTGSNNVTTSKVTVSNSTVTQNATSEETSSNKASNNSSTKKWPEKVIEIDSNKATSTEMVAKITPWDELSITGQYNEIEFNGVRYSTRSKTIDKGLLTENLGIYKAIGLDEINDKLYEKNVTAYAINTLSKNAVIAVNFEGTSEFYVATNPFYSPATLGDFINDLNLKENLTFGLVGYDNSRGMGDDYVNEKIELTNLKPETVWEKLLNDTSLKNVYSVDGWYIDKMNISTSFSLLGYKNISIGITEDGYITTNILDTGKAFFIGKEKANEFMDYVLNNCDGYKIIYKDISNNKDSSQKKNSSGSASSFTASYSVSKTK